MSNRARRSHQAAWRPDASPLIATLAVGGDDLDSLFAHLDALGCTCGEVELLVETITPDLSHVDIGHQDACPVLVRRERRSN